MGMIISKRRLRGGQGGHYGLEETEVPGHVVKVKVDDGEPAKCRYHGNPDESLKIVGITGTNGKLQLPA